MYKGLNSSADGMSHVVPIGHAFNDGLEFERNPRHDEDGRWRRRVEWPEELR